MGSESDFWTTPSETELSEAKARRQRSDMISKIMSDYLLKGHRMLATYCPECANILMADKQGRQFCIACEEVDKQPAAPKQQHQDTRSSEATSHSIVSTGKDTTLVNGIHQSGDQSMAKSDPSATFVDGGDVSALAALQEAKAVLISKLRSATKRLEQEENPAACIDYASMIKSYSEALTAVNEAAKSEK